MKFLGSKSRIALDILPIMLAGMKEGDVFVDAFCGGCNMLDKVPDIFRRIANDKNKWLIAMWKSLVAGNGFPMKISRELYNECRDCAYGRSDKYPDDFVGWVGWMGSYNGRWVDSGYSGHNVNGRDYISEQIRNTLRQTSKLANVEWHCGDYFDIPIPDGSTIYCDIPYKDTKQYSTSKNFDYDSFYQWCRDMKSKGHRIFVSEYQMPDDFKCVWEKQITNAMNQRKTYKPTERLFTL